MAGPDGMVNYYMYPVGKKTWLYADTTRFRKRRTRVLSRIHFKEGKIHCLHAKGDIKSSGERLPFWAGTASIAAEITEMKKVLAFLQGKEVVPVCPEVEAGLPVPRPPVEIRRAGVRKA